jgi:hypothetical protein
VMAQQRHATQHPGDAHVVVIPVTQPVVRLVPPITGGFDLLVMVRARSSNHLGELLEEIRQHAPGHTRAIVVLATYFEGRLPTLESYRGSLSSR